VATGTLVLPIGAARVPDGSASNLAPAITSVKSSASAPSPYFLQAAFDAAGTEQIMWSLRAPTNYASGPVLKVQWKAAAVTGDVRWEGRLAAFTPGTDSTSLDAKAFAAANNATTTAGATTAQRVVETSITLTNADSIAAGDFAVVYLARLGADGADTMSGDALVVAAALDYTTT
jgi:hypothetical protein